MTTKTFLNLAMACIVATWITFGWSSTAHAQCAPVGAGAACKNHCTDNCQGSSPRAICMAGCPAGQPPTTTTPPTTTPPTKPPKTGSGTPKKKCCDGSLVEKTEPCPGMKLCADGSEIFKSEPCPGEIVCQGEVEGVTFSYIFQGKECPDLTAGADEDEDEEGKCDDPCFNQINESIADINGGAPWWLWILVVLLVITDIVLLLRNKKDEDEGGTTMGEPAEPPAAEEAQPQPAAQPRRKSQSLD